jgi:gliding motility-associated-like protein
MKSIAVYLLIIISLPSLLNAQSDNYILIDQDDFEYTNAVPYVVPGSLNDWFEFPRTDCAPQGARSLFLNFRDNYTGIALNRSITVCPGASYYFSWIMGNCFTAEDNNPGFIKPSVTVRIEDGLGNVYFTQSWVNMTGWQSIQTPPFIPLTGTIFFRLYTDIPGSPFGNDLTFDDLRIYQNNPIYNFETISGSPLELCSADDAVNLQDYLLFNHPAGTWSGPENLPNGIQATFDPEVNTSGTYTFVTTSSAVCPDTTTIIPIVVGLTPELNVLQNLTECGSYILPAIEGTNLSGNQAYYSQPGGLGTVYNAGFEVTSDMTFYVYDESTVLSQCFDEFSFTVTILPAPNAGADFSNSYCLPTGSNLVLSSLIGTHDNNGTWFDMNNPAVSQFNASTASLAIDQLADGTYNFIYTVPAIASCEEDTAFVQITVFEQPNPTITVSDSTACIPQMVSFDSGTSANPNFVYSWNFSTGATSSEADPELAINSLGCVNASLTVTNQGSCSATVTANSIVCGYITPTAFFTMDQDTLTAWDPILTGNNLSENTDSYIWNFGTGQTSTEFELNHSFEGMPAGYYDVILIALTEQGCSDTMTLQIYMHNQFLLEVPNVFTPNGDGANDIFTIKVEGTKEIEWVVLNRWGNIMTSGRESLSPASHIIPVWDGKINGVTSPDGVYFIKVNYTDYFDESGMEHGHVTLIQGM